jgi:hypothetical protein
MTRLRSGVEPTRYSSLVRADEREVLERAIQRVTEEDANGDAIVDEAMDAGLDGRGPFVVNLRMLRRNCCQ